MNRKLHKVIFNKNTGLMTIVSEDARNNGKASGADSSLSVIANEKSERGNLLTTTSSVISFGSLLQTQDCSTIGGLIPNPTNDSNLLKPIAATLLIAGLMGLSQHSYAEAVKTQITADKSAPHNQQAQIHKTANGKAQVNISTATARGVSMNQFKQFDVGDNDSVIINNSRKATNTQTAGWINGNPNLARGEAKIIVNQVNSNDPSKLNGYIEIGGKKAELIMANPSGIAVNGGGFINANKVQLVSGSVKFDDGEVKGFHIDNKKPVAINGKGMDASDTEYTQIISAAAKINAEIYANNNEVQINAVSGSVDETGKGKNQGQVAVDVSHLGGMYAGKITLVGNEKGFAVNNQGKLIAADKIHIDASGKVSNTAGTDKDGNKTGIISADTVEIKAQKLADTGVIQGKNTRINTQDKFTISSKLVAEDSLEIQSDKGIENKTELLSQNIQLKTSHLSNTKTGKVRAMNLISADISENLNNDGEINGSKTALQVKGDINNSNTGKINGEIVQFNGKDLHNQGEIEANSAVVGR
ncbi:MAG: filamentous hemagglutinin N-terminal domain-containing protein, partial [Neisseriaceae bacterium]|nr:filamentous hemagglutinin N-terminal domain-containing protein [Neisseriaceae bacterium]